LWKIEQVDYPHAWVQLNFCRVTRWTGELQMREGQTFSWQRLPVQVEPVLTGTWPVLRWLEQEASSN
jgi:8-oxo-dGTP diphosphatase